MNEQTIPAIELRNVSKTFYDGGTLKTLHDVTLSVWPGEFVALIGPSGCGKSTLLRMIADLTPASSGEVRLKGKPAYRARLDRDYGIVFQNPVLYDWRTVEKNVQLPLEIIHAPREQRERRTLEMLQLVGLNEFGAYRPDQLSGGMQQRVAIARALTLNPSILLMDEPFGALDEITRERLNLELLRIWENTGTTILFVTHSVPEAVFLSSRVVVMTQRPAQIAAIIPIPLQRPRTMEMQTTPEFVELVQRVRQHLREE
ncbi:MAG: ABC transporter ATP-binding protein [Chloroflexi bacterium]|nr:ABC transporter ATP-binding protein [Chloroflexota bacterium]